MDIFLYILIGLGAFVIVFVLTWLLFGSFIKRKDNPQPGQTDMELIKEYVSSLRKEQPSTPTRFAITRQDIVDWIKTLEETDITVHKRTQDPQMPHSFRWNGKTFALTYGTDVGVLLIVRIQDTYAKELSKIHRVDRSTFPKGPCWWAIPLDHTWTSKEMVLELLKTSIAYVKAK